MSTLLDGKYEVLSKMKEGGMGAIFMVRHVLLDEIRVIKTMRTQIEDDPDARKRFYREAKLAKDLKHENIASFIDFFEDQDHTFYMVMDYIEGSNLSELIERRGRLPITTVLDISIQTLDALAYLHRKGIIHRDISPENIMLTEDHQGKIQVKLIDLGVAKQTSQQTMTEAGIFVGKLKYGSPEQLGVLKKGETIDGRSDLYSLGAVIYFALSGKHAFDASTPQAYISQHLVRGPRPFPESDPEGRVHEELRAIVMKSLAKNRQERFSSAEDMGRAMREELDRLLSAHAMRDPQSTDMRMIQQETMAVFHDVHQQVMAKRRHVAAEIDHNAPTALQPGEDEVPPTMLVEGTPAPPMRTGSRDLRESSSPGTPALSGSEKLSGMTKAGRTPAPAPAPAPAPQNGIWDFPTMHVDAPGSRVPRPQGDAPAQRPSSGQPEPTKKVTTSTSARPVTGRPAQEVKSSPPKPTLKREQSALADVGPSKKWLYAGGAAFVVVVGIALALVLSRDEPAGTGAPGALQLTASPWARVVSVVDAGSGKEVAQTTVATPARIELPAGRYRITLRGNTGSGDKEQVVECEVVASVETRLHVPLDGFDLERAVRTYVP